MPPAFAGRRLAACITTSIAYSQKIRKWEPKISLQFALHSLIVQPDLIGDQSYKLGVGGFSLSAVDRIAEQLV